MKLVSWNVNSLRSCETSFLQFVSSEQPDVVMLQELRAEPSQLSFFLQLVPCYSAFFNPSGRPGYGGTAWYHKEELPIEGLTPSLGYDALDSEGRTISADLNAVKLVNFYTPNGNRNAERLKYKLDFYDNIKSLVTATLAAKQSIIIGGDLNLAHTELDLYAPAQNAAHSGFLQIERKLFQDLLDLGMVDSFRLFEKAGGHYSWWHMSDPKRVKNNGWRFDYFLVSADLAAKVNASRILKDVYGSDHAPIMLEIAL